MTSYRSGQEDNEDPEDYELKPYITEDARERPPGLLTYDDREYLLGEKDVEGTAETQLRQRLRDRVRAGLLDFELLLYLLNEQDIRTIFDGITEPPWRHSSDVSEVYRGSRNTLAFVYYGIDECTHASFENLLETAIEDAGGRSSKSKEGPHEKVPNATVNIDVDWSVLGINVEHALEKLREGEPLTEQELGGLVRSGELEDDDWERLKNLGE